MADYTKMKNAELEALLKERGLPHTGKKADMVKRLQDSDEDKPATTKNEDEIDWDDDEGSKPTTEAAEAAIKAGGQGQPPNPQAVPNQIADIDPSKTNDLTVSKPEETASQEPATTESVPAPAPAPAADTAEPEPEAKPAVDFTSGLATTTLDQEIEKRKARAKKFGLEESEDEALKALERAKRFGNTDLPGKLNEALPERRERKRARENPAGGEDANAARKKRQGGGQRDGEAKSAPKPTNPKKSGGGGGGGGGGGSWMTEVDKAKAEARKAKFG